MEKTFRKFNEIFREDVTSDNVKIHKDQWFTISLGDTFLEKPLGRGGGGGEIDHPPATHTHTYTHTQSLLRINCCNYYTSFNSSCRAFNT